MGGDELKCNRVIVQLRSHGSMKAETELPSSLNSRSR